MKRTGIFVSAAMCVILIAALCSGNGSKPVQIEEDHYKTFYRIANSPVMGLPKPEAWQKAVPGIQSISIKSSADGTMQPALF